MYAHMKQPGSDEGIRAIERTLEESLDAISIKRGEMQERNSGMATAEEIEAFVNAVKGLGGF